MAGVADMIMKSSANSTRTAPDKNSPRKGKWSVVDTVILLLAILVVGALVYRVVYAFQSRMDEEPQTIYDVFFSVDQAHRDVLSEVSGFDSVYLYENDVKLGYMGVYRDADGDGYRVALTPLPADKNDTSEFIPAQGCLVCTDAVMQDGGLLVAGSGRYLTPGSVVEVRTDRAYLTLRITEIRTRE